MASRSNASPGSKSDLVHVRKLETQGGYRLKVWFTDGRCGEHDFSPMVARPGPMVEPLRDRDYFARVFVEWGAPTWPNGFDISPEALYEDMQRAQEFERDGQAA